MVTVTNMHQSYDIQIGTSAWIMVVSSHPLHHPGYPVAASVFRDIVNETHWVTEIGIGVRKTHMCTGRLTPTVTSTPCSVHTRNT